jgi:hypothetical protein
MNKHTPGPWRTIESTNKTVRTVVGPDFPGQGYIADVNLCRTNNAQDVDGEANARLIAAAPELLEVCKYLVHMIGEENVPGNCIAAINKAEGREG